ncbi:hypothetical protein L798_12847 [Zootermopsis nevadensis]|uniref:Uncharacterized protein n=1 Tax=Zootermopsis nevadensis TaxID=136037 RepID=A0A067RQ32_ZOONE|nr:hypothetical protein L798_12847 [Zootermopsis nevadensis]
MASPAETESGRDLEKQSLDAAQTESRIDWVSFNVYVKVRCHGEAARASGGRLLEDNCVSISTTPSPSNSRDM